MLHLMGVGVLSKSASSAAATKVVRFPRGEGSVDELGPILLHIDGNDPLADWVVQILRRITKSLSWICSPTLENQ